MPKIVHRRSLELIEPDYNHYKFWTAVIWDDDENTLEVTFGRIGTKGQTQVKRFPTLVGAMAYLNKKVTEKQAKGYESTGDDLKLTPGAAAPPPAPPAPPEPEKSPEEVKAALIESLQGLRA